jgi:hypothetical protein
MIFDILDAVFDNVDTYYFGKQLDAMQEALDEEKNKQIAACAGYCRDKDQANATETWKAFRETEKKTRHQIDTLVRQRDQCNLSSLYIQMGILNTYNGFMLAYGAVAEDVPKLQLKGSGDIILKSAKQKNLYVTKHEVGGSPTGVIHEVMDTINFGRKAVVEVRELAEEAVNYGKDSKKLAEGITDRNKKNTKDDEKENNTRKSNDATQTEALNNLKNSLGL